MSLHDIELLVNKIDQAIKIIKNLKDENKKSSEKCSLLQNKINALEEENNKLRKEINSKENEILKTNALHEKLEDKVKEILKYLPDDEMPIENGKQGLLKNAMKIKDKDEEEEIKEFVESESNSVKKNLFSNFSDNKKDQSQVLEDIEEMTEDNIEDEDLNIIDDDINIIDDEQAADDELETEPDAELVGADELADNKSEDEKKEVKEEKESGFNLIDDEKGDIEFYFDADEKDDDELPKGVL